MKLALLSDIHANLTALKSVISYCDSKYDSISICLLGDLIDYGMGPNETMNLISSLKGRLIVNLLGNHEKALLDASQKMRFSSDRGRQASEYTASILEARWLDYFRSEMSDTPVSQEIDGLKILFVHGDLSDVYWGTMQTKEQNNNQAYQEYDVVISGHTHIPLLNYVISNKKHSTLFINPGSVGQPRNLCPNAQFAVLDTKDRSVCFECIPYAVQVEYDLYDGSVDSYYAKRLLDGI